MNEIKIDEVSFAYPKSGKEILKDISLTAYSGEFVCILGQSGCGKSTLLRLLAGLEKPTSGVLSIDNQVIEGASLSRGMVFQDYGLFLWMTVGENILLALKQKYPKQNKKELRKIALNLLEMVGLEKSAFDKFPKELSGGMKQRCAIAQAFSTNPPILLMDEPFGALDAMTRAKLQDLLLTLWTEEEPKKTIFFVTHDIDEALLLGNRIIVLGQSPSRVIYEFTMPKSQKPTRETQFEDPFVLQMRNQLIKQINKTM